MVEAIETLFEPVVIYNNQGGEDAKVLRRFREPSWNYQVVRFLDEGGQDIIPRKDRVWTLNALAKRMVEALEKKERQVPLYLKALAGLPSAESSGKTAFAMFCFWTGEMRLGSLEGVLTTEAGWFDGREVTLVTFDRRKLPFLRLLKHAESIRCANRVYTTEQRDRDIIKKSKLGGGTLDSSYRRASLADQKRQLQGTPFHDLDLSPVQSTKVNAFARLDPKLARAWLSPRQLQTLQGK